MRPSERCAAPIAAASCPLAAGIERRLRGGQGARSVATEAQDDASIDEDPRHEGRFRRAVERGVEMSRGRHEVAASKVGSGDGVFDRRGVTFRRPPPRRPRAP